MFHFPAIFLICDNCTGWHILDHRGLCCCLVVTGLWLYSQRSSYHCSAITSDLICGACILLFYRMTLTFIFSQNEKVLLPRKAIKFCLPTHIKYKYCIQLTKIMWKSILYISINFQYVHFHLYNSGRDSSYLFPKNSVKSLSDTHTHIYAHTYTHAHTEHCV